MTERRDHIEKALWANAEAGVPDIEIPWSAIRRRALAGHRSERRRSSRQLRLTPKSRASWILATLAILFIVSTGAYATGGIMDVLDFISGETVPYIQTHKLGMPVNELQSRKGVTVSIDRVYADSAYVVVGFHVDGLNKLADKPGNPLDDLLADMWLSDPTAGAGSRRFVMVDSYSVDWAPPKEAPSDDIPRPPKGSQVGIAVFQSPTKLEPGEEHHFRAKVGIYHGASQEPIMPLFVFDLKAPVKSAPTIEVNQTVEANGVPITLTRIVNSPVSTYAFLCFDPPQDKYDWPAVKTGPFEGHLAEVSVYHKSDVVAAQNGCATYNYGETLYDKPGTHSLTITKLRSTDQNDGSVFKGPWRFRFNVPKR